MAGKNPAKCVFCKYNTTPELLEYQDDQVMAFKDIRPRGKVHLLIVPKVHVGPVTTLNSDHVDLINHMEQVSNTLVPPDRPKRRVGFHVPPMISQYHLHLHVMDEVPWYWRWQFPIGRFGRKNFYYSIDKARDLASSVSPPTQSSS